MLPRFATHTIASARVAASALRKLASASPRDFGGSGNAGAAAAVNAQARSSIRSPEKENV
jgi:hypothetical protein